MRPERRACTFACLHPHMKVFYSNMLHSSIKWFLSEMKQRLHCWSDVGKLSWMSWNCFSFPHLGLSLASNTRRSSTPRWLRQEEAPLRFWSKTDREAKMSSVLQRGQRWDAKEAPHRCYYEEESYVSPTISGHMWVQNVAWTALLEHFLSSRFCFGPRSFQHFVWN